MNEQTVAIAPLRATGNLVIAPEQIELLSACKTLAGQLFARDWRQFGGNLDFIEGRLYPAVNALVTFDRFQRIPGSRRRKEQRVGPVRVMRHQPSPGGPAHQRAQRREVRNVRVALRVTKAGSGLAPTIEAENGAADG